VVDDRRKKPRKTDLELGLNLGLVQIGLVGLGHAFFSSGTTIRLPGQTGLAKRVEAGREFPAVAAAFGELAGRHRVELP